MKSLVLLVNFGAPRSLEEVPGFLERMMGRRLPEAMVAEVTGRYRAIGGASPLAAITEEQAALLAKETGGSFPVCPAYRYSHPTLEERIDEARKAKVERLIFFVMSPFYASRTTEEYSRTVEAYLEKVSYRPSVSFIHSWYMEPAFIECWATRISRESPIGGSFYLFSAHSLPLSSREPYESQVAKTVEAVAARLHLSGNYALAWQSVPQRAAEPWITPSVETVLDGLKGKTAKVVEVPIGFVSDHLETRYDMDILHREHALALNLQFTRIPSLNTYPPFISALAAILAKSLGAIT